MKIGFDIDNCLNNLAEAVLEVYNEDSGDNLTTNDITDYMIEKFVKPEYKEDFPRYFIDKRVWKRVKPNQEAVDLVNKLHEDGHKIYFITSTEPYNLHKKCGWLQRIFPQIDINKVLIRLVQKQLIDVDILIDDCYGNLAGDTYYSKILLDKPWNRNLDDIKESILRYNNWKDIKSEICELVAYQKSSSLCKKMV